MTSTERFDRDIKAWFLINVILRAIDDAIEYAAEIAP